MEDDFLADYCWTAVGSQRRKVITVFNSERLPNQIQKETNLNFCNVSRVLKGMVERGLIERLDFEEKYRLYKLTEKGEAIKNKIDST